MSGVVKATVSMTVYLPGEDMEHFRNMSLDNILYEVSEGAWIASGIARSEPEPLVPEVLKAELEKIGNDGSFFDDSDVERLTGGM